MNKIDEAIEAAWQKSHFNEGQYDPNYPIKASNNFAAGFKAGMKFALSHQWRSVDEKLPDDDYDTVVVYTDCVNNICFGIARYNKHFSKWQTNDDDVYANRHKITYWMPIPPLSKQRGMNRQTERHEYDESV